MNYKDITAVVQQAIIPTQVQEDILSKARKLINDDFEVEVIVSTTNITLDVYDESGMRVDRIKRTFSKDKVASIEGIKPDNLEIFE